MRMIRWLLAVVAATFLLAGCGSGSHTTSTTPSKLLRGPQSCIPQEGSGVMGKCAPAPSPQVQQELKSTRQQASHVARVPDVSEFQGHPNWALAKGSISGAIARVADGFHDDVDFAYNWHELRRLHIWHAAYFFVRPGDCAGEARRAVALVNAQGGFDSGPLIADAEVPLNFGCAAAFVAEAKRLTGEVEVIYTAPGTWAGGPHGHALLWVASYGPSPGCVWSCSHVAWQYTDGVFGPFPHCTPGIGCDDISTDNGITSLGHKAPPAIATRTQKRAELHRAYRRRSGAERDRLVLHKLIDKHHCRKGQHATPRSYHTVCGHWLKEGNSRIAYVARESKLIAKYRHEGLR